MKKALNIGKIGWGLLFIAGAVAIILQQSGVEIWGGEIDLFKGVVLLFLAWIVVANVPKLDWWGVFLPVGVGLIIMRGQLGIEWMGGGSIMLAAVLLSIGFATIWPKKSEWETEIKIETDGEDMEEVIDIEDENEVRVEVSFGAVTKHVKARSLRRARLECSFGSLKVYFDKAQLNKSGKAEVNLDISFGAAELYMPKEWVVVNKTDVSFGGLKEKNPQVKGIGEKKIILTGDVSFGGVEITYV